MHYLIFITLLLLPAISVGQNSYWISGQVINNSNGEPLPNVHVQVVGSFFGTITDHEGQFYLELSEAYPTLKFSHLSFETLLHKLNPDKSQYISISLQPKSHPLNPISIVGDGVEKVVKNDSITIFNYSFINNHLLLMIYNYHDQKYYLQLTTLTGERISRKEMPNRMPYRFFTDCMGNQHLLGRDSCYQLHEKQGALHYLYPSNRYTFLNVMESCAAAKGEIVYLQSFSSDGHTAWYGFVKKGQDEATQLRKIVDVETMKKLAEYEEFLAFREAAGMSAYDRMAYRDFGNLIFNKPIYAPLFTLNDKIYIFNHPENRIEQYEWGNIKPNTISIQYHENDEFERKIIIDPLDDQPYAVFEKQENFYLRAVNLQDGSVSAPIHLKHRFPDKINVFNGNVFYLYNKIGYKEQFLFRMKVL